MKTYSIFFNKDKEMVLVEFNAAILYGHEFTSPQQAIQTYVAEKQMEIDKARACLAKFLIENPHLEQ